MAGKNATLTITSDVKTALLRLRGEKRLKSFELAREIGITEPTLRKIETETELRVQKSTYAKVTNWIAKQI